MSTLWINRGHFYCPHVTPVLADCQFKVAPADSAGLGITNLKGQAVQNVFMHTSATPGKGNGGILNPNPAAGLILVQLSDNYTRFYGHFASLRSPATGTNIAVDASDALLTAGVAYVITVVGTSTAADWVALGVPIGVKAAVGVSFVAIATGAGTGNGQVQASATDGADIDHLEVFGDPNLSIGPVPVGGSPNTGGWILFQCFEEGALAAPATGTIINLDMYLNQSSVLVAGE